MFKYTKQRISALLCAVLISTSLIQANAAELSANSIPFDAEYTSSEISFPKQSVSENLSTHASVSSNSISDNSVSENKTISENGLELEIDASQAVTPLGEEFLSAPTISSITNPQKGVAKLKFNSVSGATGYEITYSRSSSFPDKNTVTLETTATSFSITNLPKQVSFHFRVRSYAQKDNVRTYSSYSNIASLKITTGVIEVKNKDLKLYSIKACKLKGKNTFVFQAKISKRIASKDDLYYLLKLNPVTDKVESVIAKSGKTVSVKHTLPLVDEAGRNLLFGKYVLAIKNNKGKYVQITNSCYITNPTAIANYTASFPKTKSKKGLQGALTRGDLGVNHSLINLRVSDVIAEGNNGVPYLYNGKVYYFKKNPMKTAIRYCNASGITLSMVFLLDYRADIAYLIPKTARKKGAAPYYAWDVTSKKSRETFEAMFSYLSELYSSEDCHVDNWILGNELNSGYAWHYYGKMSYQQYVKTYSHAFRIMSYAVKSHYKNARCYISLDTNWQGNGKSLGGRQFMLDFNRELKAQNKNINWNLAFHAYPVPITEAAFWNNKLPRSDEHTLFINPKNLNILTSFVKKNFGKKCHIILSEQGFTSTSGEATQAAAIAYAYYIAEFNDMIDSFIMRSEYDNLVESNAGLKMGLKDINSRRKLAYDVYKYMDTPLYKTYTQDCLKTLGKSNWKQLVKGFKGTKFK